MSDTTLAPPAPVAAAPPAFSAKARVLLLQVRDKRKAELHEQQCFVGRLGVARERLDCVNVVERAVPSVAEAATADLVILGGGSHDAYRRYAFTEPLADLVRELVERHRPFFGACFGHQFLGIALGGTVVPDEEHKEVGTYELELTAAGEADPVLHGFPRRFTVQLGHHDRIDVLPPALVTLASSERCTHQLVRVPGKPVYGAQFHAEMTQQDMRTRVGLYPEYDPNGELVSRLRETPYADTLLARFVAEYV